MMDEIKVGDVFEITYTVVGADKDRPDLYECRRDGTATVFMTDAGLLAGRRVARPLAIGDRVRERRCPSNVGKIIGVHGEEAWIVGNGLSWVYALSDLERAPAPDTKEGTA